MDMAKQFKHQWHIFVDHLPKHDIGQNEFANLLINFVRENAHFFQQEPFTHHAINELINLRPAKEYPIEMFISKEYINSIKKEFIKHKLERPLYVFDFIVSVFNRILLVNSDKHEDCKSCTYPWSTMYVNKSNRLLCNVCGLCGLALYLNGQELNEDEYKELSIPTKADFQLAGYSLIKLKLKVEILRKFYNWRRFFYSIFQ